MTRHASLVAAASFLALFITLLALASCTSRSTSALPTATPTETPEAIQTHSPSAVQSSTPTATRTPSSTATVTRTFWFTSTMVATTTPVPNASVSGTPIQIAIDCWNSGGCTVCGSVLYSCTGSGGWTGVCAFTDPCPSGLVAKQVAAKMRGAACANGTSFSTEVNGIALGTTTDNDNCLCGVCSEWVHLSQYYGGGFPGWVAGGSNTFLIPPVIGQLCVTEVVLTIGCE